MESFESLLGKSIVHLGKDIRHLLSIKLNSLNLGSGQFFIVMKIYENEGVCQEELSKLMKIDKTTAAKSIKKIIQEGYIKKKKDEFDKRYYRLYTTEKGKEVYPKIVKILRETEEEIKSDFTPEELKVFNSFLEKVKHNLMNKII